VEVRLHKRLQDQGHHRLRNAIRHGRDSELPLASVFLGNAHYLDRRRKVAARGQPVPELVEVVLEVALEFLYRTTVFLPRTPPSFHFATSVNVVIMPHTSAGTDVSQAKGMEVFCENLRQYLQGEPLVNVIDWQRG
jgi:hypothetical protein